MSAAEKFLREKRGQQSMSLGTSVAPSRRYDQMGGYGMDIGQYTGKGPDNKTQPMNPTQRRIDANGNDYIVDENEVVVIDSQTLNAYGGPQAFQQFVQQNKPGGQVGQQNGQQFASGGIPTRRYYNGGIPTSIQTTRNRGLMSAEQKGMLREIESGVKRYREGGVPTLDGKLDPLDPKNVPKSAYTSTKQNLGTGSSGLGLANPTKWGEQTVDAPKAATMPAMSLGAGTPDAAKPGEIKLNPTTEVKVDPLTTNSSAMNTVMVDQLKAPDAAKPGEIKTVDQLKAPDAATPGVIKSPTPAKTPPVATPTYSPSNIDEMIWNRYAGRMGAQQEAQRAGEAQRGLQAGMSDQEIAGRGAIGDIGRREAMAGATAEFATGAAERAEARDQFNQGMSQQTREFEEGKRRYDEGMAWAKEQYGDLEGQRIANDINSGMTYDQIKAKYPNVTQEAFNSMSKGYNLDIQAAQLGLDSTKFADLKDRINSGATLKDLQNYTASDGTKPYANLTQDAFNSMQSASPWGQTQYNQKINTINSLIAQGGKENLKTAQKMFEEQFGETIDFSRALTEENSADFNAAWNNMNGLIAKDMDWKDALATMKADGSFDKLNMDVDDVERMYNQQKLQSNPVYQSMKMVDDLVEQGVLDQGQADQLSAFIAYQISNPGGVVFENGFQVKDAKGNEVGFFTDKAEADAFIASNPNKGYVSGEVQNHVRPKDSTIATEYPIGYTKPNPNPQYDGVKRLFGRDPTPDEMKLFTDDDDMSQAFSSDNFKDYTVDDIPNIKNFYNKLPDDYKKSHKLSDIIKRIDKKEGDLLSAIESGSVVDGSGSYNYNGKDYSIKDLFSDWSDWSTSGKNHWVFKAPTKKFLEDNVGKYITMNGKTFKIKSYKDGSSDKKHSSPQVVFEDPKTGKTITISSQKSEIFHEEIIGEETGIVSKYQLKGVAEMLGNNWSDSDKMYFDNY